LTRAPGGLGFTRVGRWLAAFCSVTADDDGGPVEFTQNTRGDDSYHAEVPRRLAFHNDVIRRRIELGPQVRHHLVDDFALDPLTVPVLLVQVARQAARLRAIGRQQQVQRVQRVLQPAGRV